jgi:asparagine synthase (glutamine-hydrolysing)
VLLAACDSVGGRAARDHIDRVSRVKGLPKAEICRANARVATWGAAGGLGANERGGWLAEGWIDLREADISPRTLRETRGDFTLGGLRGDGVLLATGRSGGYRPVYVASPSPEVVLACTHLAHLLDHLPQRPRLDLEYLSGSLMSYGPQGPESTPYASIRRLPMGEAWIVRPGAPPERWSTTTPLLDPELRDDADLAPQLRAAIADAVQRCARGAARLGVQVSGGLDSSTVLSLLVCSARAGEISAPPVAFMYESEVPSWHDDLRHLRSLEAHLDASIHRITPARAKDSLVELMVVDGMPAPSTMLSAAHSIGAVTRAEGVDVMLTGDGSDQVLDGTPRLFGELARKGHIVRGLDGALETRGGACFYQGRLERLGHFFLRPLADPLLPQSGLRTLRRWRRRPPPWAGPALAQQFEGLAFRASRPETLDDSPGERYARSLGWPCFGHWAGVRLQEEIVTGYARRDPFFDDEFLRFAATLPPLSLMRGGFIKGLMREAIRGLVPEDLRLRETKGTSYFFTEQAIAAAGGVAVLSALADVRMLADLRLVEPGAFRRFLNGFGGPARRDANYRDVWCILSTEAFLRQYAGESRARAA